MRPVILRRRMGGVTLMEMVVVLAVLALIGTYAVVNFGPTVTASKLKSGSKGLQALGMFARNEAIAQNRTIRLRSSDGHTVEVQDATDPDKIKVLKSLVLEGPVSLPELDIAFDSAGRLFPLGTEKKVSLIKDTEALDASVHVPVVKFFASGMVQSCIADACE